MMRNAGIELFRVLCMVAICTQHAVHFSGTAYGCESRFWSFGVVGFAFISGWFGVSLRLSRILSLWCVALSSVAISTAFAVAEGWSDRGFTEIYKEFLFTNWYLNGYTILLLLSPILNGAIEYLRSADRVQRSLTVMGMAVLVAWSWASEQWGIREFVPNVPGNGSHSFMALIYIYLFARVLNVSGRLKRMPFSVLIGCCVVCAIMNPFVGGYTSVCTWGLTVGLFVCFERMVVPGWIFKGVSVLVPSLFAVYLIHTNWFVFGLIHDFAGAHVLGRPLQYAVYLLIAGMLFCASVVLDVPRRLVLMVGIDRRKRMLEAFDRRMARLFDKMLEFWQGSGR